MSFYKGGAPKNECKIIRKPTDFLVPYTGLAAHLQVRVKFRVAAHLFPAKVLLLRGIVAYCFCFFSEKVLSCYLVRNFSVGVRGGGVVQVRLSIYYV